MGKCLDIQFTDIFLMGNSCSLTCAERSFTGEWLQFYRKLSLSLAKISCVFGLDSSIVNTSVEGGRMQHLFVGWRQRSLWPGVRSRSFSPTCVLHGGSCLRVNSNSLHTMCNLSWWVILRRSTSKHNLSQWFGVMPINVVSSVYYMKCVILRWVYLWRHFSKNK